MAKSLVEGVYVKGPKSLASEKVLTIEAQNFLSKLHRRFNTTRLDLLKNRARRQEELNLGAMPGFLNETKSIREDKAWQVASTPDDLQQRWVEITGPTERKMMINALNSGADTFMADFEDSLSPTWKNIIEGQVNLIDAIDRTITFTNPDGKNYSLKDKTAVLILRPRGWHLEEKHFIVDGDLISGSLFDFGLYFFHNAKRLLSKGTGPYFYLPKMESHLEARLWNDVFNFAQDELEIPRGTIRATVLIETILAAFEMEEMLYELKEHSSGLNAGRWDYIFSIIKKFQEKRDFVFPDRGEITMTVPFMRAYTELLIKTCHKRGAHAMGGMAAFIPNRKDEVITEKALKKVKEDKLRESSDGFDGTWVAHPNLVLLAHDTFQTSLKSQPNQKARLRSEVNVSAQQLLDFQIPDGHITEAGVIQNINICLQYLSSWLSGVGAAAIDNLMEDAATAEISRAQLWQWVNHPGLKMNDRKELNTDLYRRLVEQEQRRIENLPGHTEKLEQARRLLDRLVLGKDFTEFLTLLAYEQLE